MTMPAECGLQLPFPLEPLKLVRLVFQLPEDLLELTAPLHQFRGRSDRRRALLRHTQRFAA